MELEFNWFLKIFMKILWEGDVKLTHSKRERKKFYFFLDYFFATMLGMTRPSRSSTLSRTASMEGVVRERKLNFCWTPFVKHA